MTNTIPQGLPGIPQAPLVQPNGVPTPVWYQFFLALFNRTGGATGSPSNILDFFSTTIGAMLYRAASGWVGLNPGPQFTVLRMGTAVPEWDKIDANPSASVGLAVVNGVATTFMRSDAAPPIDQTITPTWTGLHTFNGGLNAVSGAFIGLAADTINLPPIAAPPAPASGWSLYTDSGNGNKLTALASTGTKVILGTP